APALIQRRTVRSQTSRRAATSAIVKKVVRCLSLSWSACGMPACRRSLPPVEDGRCEEFMSASRRKAGDKIIDRLTRDKSTTTNFHRTELSSCHQLVNAGAADTEFLGGELDRTQARRAARDFLGFAHI